MLYTCIVEDFFVCTQHKIIGHFYTLKKVIVVMLNHLNVLCIHVPAVADCKR